jgi:hypothetical protein
MRVPCGEFDSTHCIGILNSGAYKKGQRLIQPIGGAATLTAEGRKFLEEKFGATEFHKNDARFIVDDMHLADVLKFFENRDPKFFEIDPLREICEELSTGEFPANEFFDAIESPLTVDEAGQLAVRFKRTVVQPFTDSAGTSPLAGKEPSRRLFHLFEIEVPTSAMFEKIRASRAIKELNSDEALTTMGGSRKGFTDEGDVIADNFILP